MKETVKQTQSIKPDSPIKRMAISAVVASLYIVLTLPFSTFSFGMVQFRLAEALTVLPVLGFSPVLGLFLGCLFSNLLNPQNLGLIDILGGSLTTLVAGFATYLLAAPIRKRIKAGKEAKHKGTKLLSRVLVLLPPVVLNALVVGSYLPYLLMEHSPSVWMLVSSILMIGLSQAVVVYAIGLPLLLTLERFKFFKAEF